MDRYNQDLFLKVRTLSELLLLNPHKVDWQIGAPEILRIFDLGNGRWRYNQKAAASGRPGLHALLNSGLHSAEFLYSKEVLGHDVLCELFVLQLAQLWRYQGLQFSDKEMVYIAAVPNGATKLGKMLAKKLGFKVAKLAKVEGRIVLQEQLPYGAILILVEDFITRGTGLIEAVMAVLSQCPWVVIADRQLCILNRGKLDKIEIKAGDKKLVVEAMPLARYLTDDFAPDDNGYCQICRDYYPPGLSDSERVIRPKGHDRDWWRINQSQKMAA